jgi:hypothetical protein
MAGYYDEEIRSLNPRRRKLVHSSAASQEPTMFPAQVSGQQKESAIKTVPSEHQ